MVVKHTIDYAGIELHCTPENVHYGTNQCYLNKNKF